MRAREMHAGPWEGPNPGSPEAVAKGCTCPVIDNHHGRGFGVDGKQFWMDGGCPLHGWPTPEETKKAHS